MVNTVTATYTAGVKSVTASATASTNLFVPGVDVTKSCSPNPIAVGAVETCTIVTTAANDLMSPLHDRMPVILNPIDYDFWLDPAVADRDKLEPLIVPYEGDEFTATPVSTFVNNVRNHPVVCR